jgi:hypothetical protein
MTKLLIAKDDDVIRVLSPDQSNQPRHEPIVKAVHCTCSP